MNSLRPLQNVQNVGFELTSRASLVEERLLDTCTLCCIEELLVYQPERIWTEYICKRAPRKAVLTLPPVPTPPGDEAGNQKSQHSTAVVPLVSPLTGGIEKKDNLIGKPAPSWNENRSRRTVV